MGLGKTIQTIASIAYDVEQGNGSGLPILIVAPNSLLDNWDSEFSKFAPNISVEIYRGQERNLNFAITYNKVILTSYNLLRSDKDLLEVQWDGIILDEAQNIKNPKAQTTLAAKALKSFYRVALTGTPIENSIYDLWSLCDFLNPGMLGDLKTFKRDYSDKSPLTSCHYERLVEAVNPYYLRRLKSEILPDLPQKNEIKVECTLTDMQKAVYQEVVNNVMEEMNQNSSKRGGLILKLFTQLKQVCNDLNLYNGQISFSPLIFSGKFLKLLHITNRIVEVKERALIFTQYVGMAKILKSYLDEFYDQDTPILHGKMTLNDREYEIDRFQNSRRKPPTFFVISLKAGGTGLNLTKANHVIHYDLWWNPAVEDQASDRAHRIGQMRNVTVHKLIVQNSVEEKIAQIIEKKRDVIKHILKSTENFSIEELRSFFSLTA